MKFKLGQVYKINFLDHVLNHDSALECCVVGTVLEDNGLLVKTSFWICYNEDDSIDEENTETCSILKSTIIKKKLLK